MESSKSSMSEKTLVKEEVTSIPHLQPHPQPHYEAFTICTMHKSTITKHHTIFNLFTRKTKTVNLSHREWGRLAASQREITNYLSRTVSNEEPVKRWQWPMSTMDIMVSLPAEVAWSVSNILDEKKASDHRGRKALKKNWTVELVSEWPAANHTPLRDVMNGKKVKVKDLGKEEDGLKDYLAILRHEMGNVMGNVVAKER